jgi:hypothetical protein
VCSVKECLASNMTPRFRSNIAGDNVTLSGSDTNKMIKFSKFLRLTFEQKFSLSRIE